MSRNTHHRQRDHWGTDLDSNVELNGAIGDWASGTDVHTVLSDLYTGSQSRTTSLEFIFDGGPAAITAGVKGYVEVPVNGTISAVRMVTDQVGSITADIFKSDFGSFPPTSSICGSAFPTITNARKYQDTTLTGWTTSVTAGDWLALSVTSATTVRRVTLSITFNVPWS